MSLFPETVETERLRLRRLSADLLDPLSAYDVYAPTRSETIAAETEYLSFDPHRTPKATADFLADAAEKWESGEGAVYAVLPDDDPDAYDGPAVEGRPYAGTTGLHVEWDRQVGGFGIHLRKPFWGRGYSGERAAALLDLAFDVLDLEVVAIPVHVDNENSRRAVARYVDRVGGHRAGPFRHAAVHADGTVVDRVRFSVGRDEYSDAAVEPGVSFRWDDAAGE
jgi:RimJ/RimL family protein N-acetyltransferase